MRYLKADLGHGLIYKANGHLRVEVITDSN
jgi:hypothetical protein